MEQTQLVEHKKDYDICITLEMDVLDWDGHKKVAE